MVHQRFFPYAVEPGIFECFFGWVLFTGGPFRVSSPMQLDLGFWNDSLVGGDLRVVHQRLFPDAVGPWDFALFYWKFVKTQ